MKRRKKMNFIPTKRHHINKINYKNEGEKYFVVSYNSGGIGTPLYNVDKDMKWFIAQAQRDERQKVRKILLAKMSLMTNKQITRDGIISIINITLPKEELQENLKEDKAESEQE